MKKEFFFTTALAACVTFAAAARANSVNASPWSLEVSGGYQFATREFQNSPMASDGTKTFRSNWSMPKVDLITADLTGVYNINDQHALTLRVGVGTGHEKVKIDGGPTSIRDDVDLYTLMPGYRYTMPVYGDSLKAFAGVNVGVAHVKYKSQQSHAMGEKGPDPLYDTRVRDTDTGFAYSAELGLRYEMTQHVGLFAAYQFSGNTADVKRHTYNHGSGNEHPDNSTKAQLYNGVRVGLSYAF